MSGFVFCLFIFIGLRFAALILAVCFVIPVHLPCCPLPQLFHLSPPVSCHVPALVYIKLHCHSCSVSLRLNMFAFWRALLLMSLCAHMGWWLCLLFCASRSVLCPLELRVLHINHLVCNYIAYLRLKKDHDRYMWTMSLFVNQLI